jgi:hypothetical protein
MLFAPSRLSLCFPIIDGCVAASRALPKGATEQAAVTDFCAERSHGGIAKMEIDKQNTRSLLKECYLFGYEACSIVEVHRCLGGNYCTHFQGRSVI